MELRKNRNVFVSWLLLIVAYVVLIWFLNERIDMHLTSDDAGELILSQLLSIEGGILSQNWYYSTELRVLNTQLIYSFFFHFLDSWHMVRIASCACMLIMLILSYLYFCRQFGMKHDSVLSAVILLLPFSPGYYLCVLKGAYYIPHILISFLAMALLEAFLDREAPRKGKYIAAAMVLAVGAGMGGPRQIIMLYLPLALAGLLSFGLELSTVYKKEHAKHGVKALMQGISDDSRRYAAAAFLVLISSLIGFILNASILAKQYTFEQWGDIQYALFEFDRLADICNGFLVSLGYTTGEFFSSATISNLVCALWGVGTILAAIHGIKNRTRVARAYYRLSLFFVSGIFVYTCLYVFSNMEHQNRYNLPIVVFSIPLIAMYIESISLKKRYKNMIAALGVILVCVSSAFVYSNLYRWDATAELRQIADAFEEADYREGYASFWNGNVLTELSDGEIEVWSWYPDGNDPPSINELYQWLQKKSHMSQVPEGKTFLLFTQEEWEASGWKDKLNANCILYESDVYIVFGYESYHEILSDLSYYQSDFQDGQCLISGEDINGVREIYKNGISYGPYITLYPGEYSVVIKGEDLNLAEIDCGYNSGKVTGCGVVRQQTPERVQMTVSVSDEMRFFEVLIRNNSDETIKLHSITIERID